MMFFSRGGYVYVQARSRCVPVLTRVVANHIVLFRVRWFCRVFFFFFHLDPTRHHTFKQKTRMKSTNRSASVPVDGDETDPAGDFSSSGGGDPSSSAPPFRSTPGVDEMLAAPTPGRETEGERTWIMARRVQSSWEKEEQEKDGGSSSSNGGGGGGMSPEAEQPSPSPSRT